MSLFQATDNPWRLNRNDGEDMTGVLSGRVSRAGSVAGWPRRCSPRRPPTRRCWRPARRRRGTCRRRRSTPCCRWTSSVARCRCRTAGSWVPLSAFGASRQRSDWPPTVCRPPAGGGLDDGVGSGDCWIPAAAVTAWAPAGQLLLLTVVLFLTVLAWSPSYTSMPLVLVQLPARVMVPVLLLLV